MKVALIDILSVLADLCIPTKRCNGALSRLRFSTVFCQFQLFKFSNVALFRNIQPMLSLDTKRSISSVALSLELLPALRFRIIVLLVLLPALDSGQYFRFVLQAVANSSASYLLVRRVNIFLKILF
jgi:hypothetical protein